MPTTQRQPHPSDEKKNRSQRTSAETAPDNPVPFAETPLFARHANPRALSARQVLHLQRTIGNRATTRLMATPSARVQRESKVEGNAAKLSFFIDQFGANVQALFTNADADKVSEFMRDVNRYWRDAYAENENKLDLAKARAALKDHNKELLGMLGKADPKQVDYQRLASALETTFGDDTNNLWGIATKKENIQKFPPGTEWWLTKVNDEGLVTAEDKSTDARLMAGTSQDHIVKTGADTADTATALFEVDQQNSAEDEINKDDRKWELHAHVTKAGDVEFAHTKADNQHMVTVNEWFADNIDETDRKWADP